MLAKGITPILNVSDMRATFDWFAKLGWTKAWEYGEPPGFGCVRSDRCEIFLCQGGQGGRGRSALSSTSDDDSQEKGVWMSIWVEDVDAVYRECVAHGLDVTHPPTDEPWNVREMHLRHPDGHVFRISKGFEE